MPEEPKTPTEQKTEQKPEQKAEQKAEQKPEQKAEQKPPVEKQTNCLGCGKPLKKLKKYYRNGKYYCTKKCWKKSIKPKESPA